MIDHIVERTQRGYDKNGKRFASYSKSYRGSLDYKLARKSGVVNLTASEEMLGSLQELNDRSGSITIGYPKGDDELNGKVEGNRLGTYGNKKPVTKPRDFLGLTDGALKRILNKYPVGNSELERIKRERQIDLTLSSRSKAEELLIDAGTEDFEG